MSAYFVLLLAVLSRILPHTFHATGMNFTAVGGSLLFFGARRSRWQAVIAMLALAATDYYLTVYAYAFPFHVSAYLATWAWYGAVCLMGSALLRKVTVLRVVGGVFASATSFFLLSNFMVWMGQGMYAHSAAGLASCYAAGLPFYGNDLLSTGVFAAAFFGLPVLVKSMVGEPMVPVRSSRD